jgi:hypothetical protein
MERVLFFGPAAPLYRANPAEAPRQTEETLASKKLSRFRYAKQLLKTR